MSVEAISGNSQLNDFNYKVVSPMTPLTLVLGILSLFGFITVFLIPFALVGVCTGWLAARKIKSSSGEFGGKVITNLGILLCISSLIFGSSYQAYAYATEVPEGHKRISFVTDISKKGFVEIEGDKEFHPDVAALDGQKLFFKGYMYPDGRMKDIKSFILCKDSGQCCFGGNPELSDMVRIVIKKGSPLANYYSGLVSVGGTFRLKDINRGGELTPVYELEATHFCESKFLY